MTPRFHQSFPTHTELIKAQNKILPVVGRVKVYALSDSGKETLIRYLLELSGAQEAQMAALPLSGKELAHFLGTAPEALSRRWSAMEKEGLLRKRGKQVPLFDREKRKESLL